MKKFLMGTLLTAMLSVVGTCSAAWVSVGDYVVDPNFRHTVDSVEYSAKTIANLSPKPAGYQSVFYRLQYDNQAEISRGGEGNSLIYLKVWTRLIPIYPNNKIAVDRYGVIGNCLRYAPKGAYGVTSLENLIVDYPPKVQQTKVRYASQQSIFLEVLKMNSALEKIGMQFSKQICSSERY